MAGYHAPICLQDFEKNLLQISPMYPPNEPQRMAQAVESTGRVTVPHRLVAKSGSYVAAIGHCGQRSEWRSLGLKILWIDMSTEKKGPWLF